MPLELCCTHQFDSHKRLFVFKFVIGGSCKQNWIFVWFQWQLNWKLPISWEYENGAKIGSAFTHFTSVLWTESFSIANFSNSKTTNFLFLSWLIEFGFYFKGEIGMLLMISFLCKTLIKVEMSGDFRSLLFCFTGFTSSFLKNCFVKNIVCAKGS